jgi:NADP-dependent 3-hydroxy acid dehydrogenase YdfG
VTSINKSSNTMRQPRSILITGASSGIGAALALGYAQSGVSLFLGGRHAKRLTQIAQACKARGATVEERMVEVTDCSKMAAWIAEADAAVPLDLVIANAGLSAGISDGEHSEPEEQVRRLFAVNVDGALNTVLPALPLMQRRGHGQIALMSSMAGFRGLAGASAYCATKAAVRVLGEGMRGTVAASGIEVSVICPGYVRTPMTEANRFTMPFLMDADRAARIIQSGLARNRSRIAFPLRMYGALWLLQILPVALTDAIVARLPRKTPVRE